MFRAPDSVISIQGTVLLGCLMGALAAGPTLAAPAGQASPPSAASSQAAQAADAPEMDDASYRDLVADAQRLLMLRGFDPGPIDGQLGLRTRQAIRAYQATARSRGVLEALKGPPPDEAKAIDAAARPDGGRVEPAASPATN
jgi:peptidoglycan hydrolase-like protein with peptidoglycan-binding domain